MLKVSTKFRGTRNTIFQEGSNQRIHTSESVSVYRSVCHRWQWVVWCFNRFFLSKCEGTFCKNIVNILQNFIDIFNMMSLFVILPSHVAIQLTKYILSIQATIEERGVIISCGRQPSVLLSSSQSITKFNCCQYLAYTQWPLQSWWHNYILISSVLSLCPQSSLRREKFLMNSYTVQ